GRAAIVLRSLRRIRHEPAQLGWRGVPEDLRDVPGPVRIVDQEPEAERLEIAVHLGERLGRRTLQERARLFVDRRAEEVVRGRVPDVELDRGVELPHLDELRW